MMLLSSAGGAEAILREKWGRLGVSIGGFCQEKRGFSAEISKSRGAHFTRYHLSNA